MTEPSHLPCPLCRHTDFAPVRRFDDGVVVGRCLACGLLYTPRVHPEPSTVLAPTTVDELRREFAPILEGRRHHNRRRAFLAYLDVLERHAPGRRLLDVGCAHGFFGRAAMDRGWTVTGVEPNHGMARFAREVNGLAVREGTLDSVDLGDGVFDAVSFTDVLEYIPDPLEALRTVAGRLAPGGVVFLKVPNARSFVLRQRVGFVPGGGEPFSPSRRVVHYTDASLPRLVRTAGLEVVDAGAAHPIHSPRKEDQGARWQELEPRWYEMPVQRAVRRLLDVAGRVEAAVAGRNDLSPALYVVGRVAGDTDAADRR